MSYSYHSMNYKYYSQHKLLCWCYNNRLADWNTLCIGRANIAMLNKQIYITNDIYYPLNDTIVSKLPISKKTHWYFTLWFTIGVLDKSIQTDAICTCNRCTHISLLLDKCPLSFLNLFVNSIFVHPSIFYWDIWMTYLVLMNANHQN